MNGVQGGQAVMLCIQQWVGSFPLVFQVVRSHQIQSWAPPPLLLLTLGPGCCHPHQDQSHHSALLQQQQQQRRQSAGYCGLHMALQLLMMGWEPLGCLLMLLAAAAVVAGQEAVRCWPLTPHVSLSSSRAGSGA